MNKLTLVEFNARNADLNGVLNQDQLGKLQSLVLQLDFNNFSAYLKTQSALVPKILLILQAQLFASTLCVHDIFRVIPAGAESLLAQLTQSLPPAQLNKPAYDNLLAGVAEEMGVLVTQVAVLVGQATMSSTALDLFKTKVKALEKKLKENGVENGSAVVQEESAIISPELGEAGVEYSAETLLRLNPGLAQQCQLAPAVLGARLLALKVAAMSGNLSIYLQILDGWWSQTDVLQRAVMKAVFLPKGFTAFDIFKTLLSSEQRLDLALSEEVHRFYISVCELEGRQVPGLAPLLVSPSEVDFLRHQLAESEKSCVVLKKLSAEINAKREEAVSSKNSTERDKDTFFHQLQKAESLVVDYGQQRKILESTIASQESRLHILELENARLKAAKGVVTPPASPSKKSPATKPKSPESDKIIELQKRIENLETQLAEKRGELRSLAGNLETSHETCRRASEQCARLEAENNTVRAELERKERVIVDLKALNQRLPAEIEQLKRQLESASSQKKAMLGLEKEKAGLLFQLNELRKEMDVFQRENRSKISELQTQRDRLSQEVSDLKQQIELLSARPLLVVAGGLWGAPLVSPPPVDFINAWNKKPQ